MAHLLIVEDDELLRDGLSAQLMQAGHRIDTAVDGEQALSRLDTEAYEGVVLDLGLPRVDGLTVLRRLRQRLPSLEITIATGNTSDVVKAVQDNALDVALVTLPAGGRNLEVTPVLDDEFVAVTSRDGVKLPARVTPEVMARLPVIMFEPGGQTRLVTDQWFFQGGVELRPSMSLGSVEAIKRLVGVGLGCAILPAVALREPGDRARLVVRRLTPRLYRKLAIVVRRDKVLQRGLRETVKALHELAEKS